MRAIDIIWNESDWSRVSDYLQLSPREIQLAQRLLSGMLAKEIATELGLSYHTVRSYIRNLYTKLQVTNRAELIIAIVTALGTTSDRRPPNTPK